MSYLFSNSIAKLQKEIQDYSALSQDAENQYLINYINNAKLIMDYWKELKPRNLHTGLKHYQRHDLFNLFYSPQVSFNKNKGTAWSSLLKNLSKQLEFVKVKKYTESDEELSALMTVRVMIRILQEMEKQQGQGQKQQGQQGQGNQQQIVDAVKNELSKDYQQIQEYKEGKEEMQQLMMMLGNGGSGFSNDSLSLLKYLQSPDNLRQRIKILKDTFMMLRKFSAELPASFRKSQLSSDQGEISRIEKLVKETQITHMISGEYSYLALARNNDLAKLLFSMRYVNKELLVYRGSASPRVSLYIDKSGSMSEHLEGVPKISLAAGLGLAMLKKFDDTKLFAFDTEVTEVDKNKIVQTLLAIEADGGTNIAEVLQKIKEFDDRRTIHIIISDGIDEVSESVINSIPAELRRRIVFILIEANAPQWLENFRYHPVKTIAEFQQAVANSLKSY
jgi:uncharacterized protein with von Willebrand factor type A (vWA) domain